MSRKHNVGPLTNEIMNSVEEPKIFNFHLIQKEQQFSTPGHYILGPIAERVSNCFMIKTIVPGSLVN
jgi:hypothetical protein